MLDIRSSLLQAEENLVDSLYSASCRLKTFENSWSSLYMSLKAVPLDDVDLPPTTASRVAVFAEGLLEFHNESKAATSEFLNGLEDLLEQLDVTDDTVTRSKSSSSAPTLHQPIITRPQASKRAANSPPTYIAPAYKWLLKNIHNPYPSKETKELLSRSTDTSLQNIDAWFLNARRRIGWLAISKKFFNGSKTDTVAAAYRALISDDPKLSINATGSETESPPLPGNIRMAFVEMEDAAKGLYSDRFSKSQLANRLDGKVKDMTDDDKERRRLERRKEKAVTKLQVEREREQREKQEAERRRQEAEEGYPSPSPSPEPESFSLKWPGPADGEREEDLISPLTITGRKRSSPDYSINERELRNARPVKRSRIPSSSSSRSSVVSVSSVSRQNSLEPFSTLPSSLARSPSPPSTPSENKSTSLLQNSPLKRKRRLSSADAQRTPARPMPLVRPRLQVVSDPLPKSLSSASSSSTSPVDEDNVPDWRQFFNQASAVVVEELDAAGPFELNMFDYSQFVAHASSGEISEGTDWEGQGGSQKSKVGFLDPPSRSPSSALRDPSLTFTDFDLPAPVSVLPDFGLDLCATRGWPYTDGIQTTSSPRATTFRDSNFANLDELSSLVSLTSHQPELLLSEPPACPDDTVFDSLSSIDWSSIIPQTIPPTQSVVPSATTIAPATIDPTAYPSICVETRTEKLRKYQEYLGQVRRLEAELAFV